MKKRLIALASALVLLSMLTSCGFIAPSPEVKEGRFDLSVTYEMDGEVKTFSAVYVCEFDGVSWAPDGFNFTRDWKPALECDYECDRNSAILGKTADGGDIILFLGVYPEYFMGDDIGDGGAPAPSIYVNYPEDENGASVSVAEPDEVAALYGIRIVSYEYDAPIKNAF